MLLIWQIKHALRRIPWYVHASFLFLIVTSTLVAWLSAPWEARLPSLIALVLVSGMWAHAVIRPFLFYRRAQHVVQGLPIFCEDVLTPRELGVLENELNWAFDKAHALCKRRMDPGQLRRCALGLAVFLMEDMSEATFEAVFRTSLRGLYFYTGGHFIIAYRLPNRGIQLRKKLLGWLLRKVVNDLETDQNLRDALKTHLT